MQDFTNCTSTATTNRPEPESDWENGYKRGQKDKIEGVWGFAMTVGLMGCLVGGVVVSVFSLERWAFWFVVALYFLVDKINKPKGQTEIKK